MQQALIYILEGIVGLLLLMFAAYLVSRAASKAYFRTRLEHFRSVIRESGERPNGK